MSANAFASIFRMEDTLTFPVVDPDARIISLALSDYTSYQS